MKFAFIGYRTNESHLLIKHTLTVNSTCSFMGAAFACRFPLLAIVGVTDYFYVVELLILFLAVVSSVLFMWTSHE